MKEARYIAIEGPIGVGKTSLATLLGRRLGARLVLERPDENPFLNDFYKDARRYAFKTQLFFTLSRYMQQQEFSQQDLFHDLVIADYLFAKDKIFAYLTLDDKELALYEKLVDLIDPEIAVPEPDSLLSRVDRAMAKIRARPLRSDRHTPWVVMHAVIAFGADVRVLDAETGEATVQ